MSNPKHPTPQPPSGICPKCKHNFGHCSCPRNPKRTAEEVALATLHKINQDRMLRQNSPVDTIKDALESFAASEAAELVEVAEKALNPENFAGHAWDYLQQDIKQALANFKSKYRRSEG